MELYGRILEKSPVTTVVTVLFVRQNWLLPYNFKTQFCMAVHYNEQESTNKNTRNEPSGLLWWRFCAVEDTAIMLLR
jgi:hypothetical protein